METKVLHLHGPLAVIAAGTAGGLSAALIAVTAIPDPSLPVVEQTLTQVGGLSGYAAVLMTFVSMAVVRNVNKFFGEHTMRIIKMPEAMDQLIKDVGLIQSDVTELKHSFSKSEQDRGERNIETEGRLSRLEGNLEGIKE